MGNGQGAVGKKREKRLAEIWGSEFGDRNLGIETWGLKFVSKFLFVLSTTKGSTADLGKVTFQENSIVMNSSINLY